MPNLKINEAPLLPDLIGIERIPTGGRGDRATSTAQIKSFVLTEISEDLEQETLSRVAFENRRDNPHQVTSAQIGYLAPFTGAVIRTQADKNTESVSVKDFADAASAVASGAVSIYFPPVQSTLTAEISVPDAKKLYAQGGSIHQSTAQTSSLHSTSTNPAKSNISITGFNLSQDTSVAIAGGTDNNHAQIKFNGGLYNKAHFNKIQGQYGISFGYGSATLTDRRNLFGQAIGNVLHNLQGMAIENLGASYTAIVANSGDASDSRGVGTRAAFHGIRLSGYKLSAGDSTEAQCIGVVAAANAFKGYARGVAIQNASSLWNISSQYIENAEFAVQMFLGTAATSQPQLGYINFTASNVGQGILGQSHHHCAFDFIIDGTQTDPTKSVVEESASGGAEGCNRYRGIIKGSNDRGAFFRYDYQRIDLTITDTATTGAVIAGSYNTGDITVLNAGGTGIALNGSSNLIRCIVKNAASTALLVAGSNNTAEVVTDGNITISGDNNNIRGMVGGTITNTGANNNLSGIGGFSGSGVFSGTTNASGEIVISAQVHASAKTFGFACEITNFTSNWRTRLKARAGGDFTVVCLDEAGAVLASTAVQVRWIMSAS